MTSLNYHFIINPLNNKEVLINTKEGKKIIQQYIHYLKGGSKWRFSKERDGPLLKELQIQLALERSMDIPSSHREVAQERAMNSVSTTVQPALPLADAVATPAWREWGTPSPDGFYDSVSTTVQPANLQRWQRPLLANERAMDSVSTNAHPTQIQPSAQERPIQVKRSGTLSTNSSISRLDILDDKITTLSDIVENLQLTLMDAQIPHQKRGSFCSIS